MPVTKQFTYLASQTAHISAVTPRRGGTGGGTRLTISGSGFGFVFCLITIKLLYIADLTEINQINFDNDFFVYFYSLFTTYYKIIFLEIAEMIQIH